MRTTPALLVLTLAASTASVAAPVVGLPGGASAHAVAPKIVEVALPADELAGRILGAEHSAASFSLIGLTWARPATGAEPDLDLSVRTRHDGAWTDWTAVEADGDGPDGDADAAEIAAAPQSVITEERAGTAPLWVGDSDGFQLRLDARTARSPPTCARCSSTRAARPRTPTSAPCRGWPRRPTRPSPGRRSTGARTGAPTRSCAIPPRASPARSRPRFVHHTAGTNDTRRRTCRRSCAACTRTT